MINYNIIYYTNCTDEIGYDETEQLITLNSVGFVSGFIRHRSNVHYCSDIIILIVNAILLRANRLI